MCNPPQLKYWYLIVTTKNDMSLVKTKLDLPQNALILPLKCHSSKTLLYPKQTATRHENNAKYSLGQVE